MERPGRAPISRRIGFWAGPLLFLAVLGCAGTGAMGVTGALTAWMAIWWMTEAIPIAATSLLPLVVLPCLAGGTFSMARVAAQYGNWRVFLFFGGFLLSIAIELTGLHRRIALRVVQRVGTGPRRLILGFMVATAFVSMWVSNLATTLMMMPIALALLHHFEGRPKFASALLLGIAYAASIGGIGTLIGTPPNITFQGQFRTLFPAGPEISFARWSALGLPLVATFLPAAWLLLTRRIERGSGEARGKIDEQVRGLGRATTAERRVFVVFISTALLWIFRADLEFGSFRIPGWSGLVPGSAVNDGVVAIAMGLLLFILPRGDGRGRILDWPEVEARIPWGILLLFGGGFALADAIRASGLAARIGEQFGFLEGAPPLLLIAGASLCVTFLTEVTSNTATAEVLLPLTAGIAVASGIDPLLLMLPVTMSASCAFMLPVATPPNAVVFSSGRITMGQMVRAGFLLNLIGVVLVTLVCRYLAPAVMGIDLDAGAPAWATGGK